MEKKKISESVKNRRKALQDQIELKKKHVESLAVEDPSEKKDVAGRMDVCKGCKHQAIDTDTLNVYCTAPPKIRKMLQLCAENAEKNKDGTGEMR